ncbi:MAG TPA: DNA primase [Candidatus Baltobacteraceae bacterium]|nr:DNA primase [Candidatus Baltobacteraceae bacterium]
MDFKDQLKSSLDIVQVIEQYVILRKAGAARYVGLCPFHSEKTPSFSVNATHQFYKCFGCGASGDVLKFVMEMEHVSFPEALKLLAERNGIPMPKRAEYADAETRLRGAVFQMQELAQEAFREQLASSPGAEARRYLEKRGVSPETTAQFGLGYAERGGRALLRLFEKQGFTAEQLENSGLLGRREDGSFYDRFRHRLMFPIHNEAGKIIGFGGRALDPADEPKYLNSAESPIYKKSAVLYNLHRAKEGIRKAERSVLVEGYMDAIGVTAAGMGEVVASCGTSLTAQQVQSLRRHSDRIVVNFDPDAAGSNAAERSINLLLNESMRVHIAELEDGLDPDEYCREHGADGYRAKIDSAKDYYYWLEDRVLRKYPNSLEGKLAGFRTILLPAILQLPDEISRQARAADAADHLRIDPAAVRKEIRSSAKARTDKRTAPAREPLRADEKILLNLLLSNGDARQELIPRLEQIPAVEQFATRRIFKALFILHGGGEFGYEELHARLEEDDQEILAAAVLQDETNASVATLDLGEECVRSLERSSVKTQVAALKARVKDAERTGNLQEALRLAEELHRLEHAR